MNSFKLHEKYLTQYQVIRILQQYDIEVVDIKYERIETHFSQYFPWTIRFIKNDAEIVSVGPTLVHLLDRILFEHAHAEGTERELVALTYELTQLMGGIRLGRFGWTKHVSLFDRRKPNTAHTFEVDYSKAEKSLMIYAKNRQGVMESKSISSVREAENFIKLYS